MRTIDNITLKTAQHTSRYHWWFCGVVQQWISILCNVACCSEVHIVDIHISVVTSIHNGLKLSW